MNGNGRSRSGFSGLRCLCECQRAENQNRAEPEYEQHSCPFSPASRKTLLFDSNPECLHFAIKMAALQPQHLSCASNVAVIFIELLQDVIAFVSSTCLMQRRETSRNGCASAFTMDQRWQMLAFNFRCSRVHDDQTLNHIPQLTNIAWPGISRQRFN